MYIPHTELSDHALQTILEEYASREGTEYGWRDYTLAEKITQLKRQLDLGEVRIQYDPESQTCNLVAA